MTHLCAVCGAAVPLPFRAPPPETAPDLDQRPGEPTRSTLARWVQACGACGACAPDVAQLLPGRRSVTEQADYKRQPSRFLRWAMLAAGTPAEAEALLQAAWEADDAGRDATELRQQAAAVWPADDGIESELRLVDVLRRAGEFEAATTRLMALPTRLDDISAQVASYQRSRIAAADTGRQLISSALRPPARRPHVSHGKPEPARSGFWSRLLGR